MKFDPTSELGHHEVNPIKVVINEQIRSVDEASSSQTADSRINHQAQGLQNKGRKVFICGN